MLMIHTLFSTEEANETTKSLHLVSINTYIVQITVSEEAKLMHMSH